MDGSDEAAPSCGLDAEPAESGGDGSSSRADGSEGEIISNPSKEDNSNGNAIPIIAGTGTGCFLLLLLVVAGAMYWKRRKHRNGAAPDTLGMAMDPIDRGIGTSEWDAFLYTVDTRALTGQRDKTESTTVYDNGVTPWDETMYAVGTQRFDEGDDVIAGRSAAYATGVIPPLAIDTNYGVPSSPSQPPSYDDVGDILANSARHTSPLGYYEVTGLVPQSSSTNAYAVAPNLGVDESNPIYSEVTYRDGPTPLTATVVPDVPAAGRL